MILRRTDIKINTKFTSKTPDKNLEEVEKIIDSRVKSLPRLMNTMVASPMDFAIHKQNPDAFSNDYLKIGTQFYKRAYNGPANQEYRENYKPEITFINKISKACKEYLEKYKDSKKLNNKVKDALKTYSNKPIHRKKFFIA